MPARMAEDILNENENDYKKNVLLYSADGSVLWLYRRT